MKRKASEFEEVSPWSQWSPSSELSSVADSSPNRLQDISTPWARISKQHAAGDNHLNLRTRKRVRDNRPDMEVIHQNTLAKLFEAQRNPERLSSSNAPGGIGISTASSQTPAQRNLHSFFRIPQSQLPKPESQVFEQRMDACEDCGNSLVDTSGAGPSEIDMMDTGDTDSIFACQTCHRNVCDMCSVRADRRLCLECALPGNG